MAQTPVQVEEAIRVGSVKWEMGATIGTLVNVGALRNAVWEYRFEKTVVKSDNAGVIRKGARNEECGIKGDLFETNLERLGSFYAGVLTHDTVAAAPTAVTDESHVLTGTTESVLTHRNGAGTEVATIVVTNAAGALTLLRDCDFVVNVNADGYTTIARAYPVAVETAAADVTPNVAGTYTSGGGTFVENLVPGDHIIISGCTNAANNGVKTVVTATDTVITVAEAVITDAPSASTTIIRGGIASEDTVLVDYSYTPLASRTLKGGGLTTFTARVCRFTNTDALGKIFRITVFSATPESGIVMNFPADDAEDPMLCPIAMTGVPDTALTAGEQLFEIFDEQHAS